MTQPVPFFDVQRLAKRFGRHVALRSIDFQLCAGEAVALLGANGAGKTTLLRVLATLTRPTRGRYLAFGADAGEERVAVRSRIGVVGHQPYLYPELTSRENLTFFATMFGLTDIEPMVESALGRVDLSGRADDRAATLSRGLLQRLDLARATLHDPTVLVLDEPDTGLDAAGRRLLERLIHTQVHRGGGVVFTSHAIDFALRCGNRAVVLRSGDVVLDVPIEQTSSDEIETAIAPDDVSMVAG